MDKELEKIMKEAYRETKKDSIFYKAMLQSYKFLEISDLCRKTNKAKIFKSLYMTRENKASLLRKSIECYVGESTLYRYRKKFAQIFSCFVDLEKNEGSLKTE